MLILILLIIIIGRLIITKYIKNWEIKLYLETIAEIAMFISIGVITVLLLSYPYNIDKQISMYEEENGKIEIKIKETVQSYMNYEKDIYENLIETADLTTLLVKYPELNSNELVKYEMTTYTENNKKIKDLKEQQIKCSTYNFWLFFGN